MNGLATPGKVSTSTKNSVELWTSTALTSDSERLLDIVRDKSKGVVCFFQDHALQVGGIGDV